VKPALRRQQVLQPQVLRLVPQRHPPEQLKTYPQGMLKQLALIFFFA
jgi:hypothetical protein